MKSQTSLKMVRVRSKTRSLRQMLENPCELVRMFACIKSKMSLEMGHVRSKTRSLGKILVKPCVCSRGHIFSSILMKHGQNVCLSKNLREPQGHHGLLVKLHLEPYQDRSEAKLMMLKLSEHLFRFEIISAVEHTFFMSGHTGDIPVPVSVKIIMSAVTCFSSSTELNRCPFN